MDETDGAGVGWLPVVGCPLAASACASAAAAVGSVGAGAGWPLAAVASAAVDAVAGEEEFDAAALVSEPVVSVPGAVGCPLAGDGDAVAGAGSGSAAASMSGVTGTGALLGVGLVPTAGVEPEAWPSDVVLAGAGVGVVGAATGTSAASATVARAAAEVPLGSVWSVCDDFAGGLAEPDESESEFPDESEEDAVWPLSLDAPLADWPCAEFVDVPVAFAWHDEPDPVVWVAVPWVVELAGDELAEFEEVDCELFCAAGGVAGAALPPPELFPAVCRMLEKLCDGAFVEAELAGGAELGAIIILRIASVMNKAAVRKRCCPARPQQSRGHSARTTQAIEIQS